ncbi:pLS20_p028 family conjugation system transmembrane protein [Enterococcus faecalis]
MSTKEIFTALDTFSDYLSLASMIKDIGRSILYFIVSILVWIVDNLTNVLKEMLKFLGFYNADSLKGEGGLVQTLISFKSFGVALAILMIGLVLLLGKSQQTRDIPMNVLMLLLMSLMLPSIMRDGIKIVTATETSLSATQGDVGFATVKDNIIDTYILAEKGWKTTEPDPKNRLTDLDWFDINERISDPDEVENGEVFNYELKNKKNGEGKEAVELDDGGGGIKGWLLKKFFTSAYYRWRADWLPMIVTLGVLAFSLIISLLRVGRLGIELAYNNIWAQLTVFFSFRDMKRAKMAFMEIISGFVMLLSIFTMYYVFIYYNSFVFSKDVSMLAQLFAVAGGAWFVYDGPAIVQKTLGIDAGLSTAGSFVMGMGAKSAADKVVDVAKTAAGATVAGVIGAAGFADGLFRGKKNDEDANLNKMDNEKNTDETNDDLPPEDEQEDSNLEKESKDTETKNTSENEGEDSETGEPDTEKSADTDKSSNEHENMDDWNQEDMEEKNSEGNDASYSPDDFDETGEADKTANEQDSSNFSEETGEKNTTSDYESTESASKNASDTSESTAPDEKERRNSDRSSASEREENTDNSLEKVENPFKKKAKDMIHTNKYQKNMKNPIGNQVDRYQRNKEFGQEVNEWLSQRKALKEQARNEQRSKNND